MVKTFFTVKIADKKHKIDTNDIKRVAILPKTRLIKIPFEWEK